MHSLKAAANLCLQMHRGVFRTAKCKSQLNMAQRRWLTSSSSEPAVDPITIDKRENITLIGLNRPHCKNAMDTVMANQLRIVMSAFEQDDTSHVAVLHGNGEDFCAGYDLKEFASQPFDDKMKPQLKENGPMGITQKVFKKPVIAALKGYVVGGGLELALACDLRVADVGTVIGGFNRVRGVPFIDGCTARLPAVVGLSRALDLILTGRPVDADEALQMGLVNRVSDGEAVTVAVELAKIISSCPQFCMLTDRHNTYYSVYNASSLSDALHHEFENAWKVLPVDSIKGAKEFANRRK